MAAIYAASNFFFVDVTDFEMRIVISANAVFKAALFANIATPNHFTFAAMFAKFAIRANTIRKTCAQHHRIAL